MVAAVLVSAIFLFLAAWWLQSRDEGEAL
jgi:hypothetical protein